MTKVAIKNENITSFGGIYHIMDVFSKLGFEKLTESVLGKRGSSGKAFSHGSIFGSLFFSYLCGGECLEDINALIGQFKQRPDTLLPGADTVGRGLKELAEENIIYKSETSDKSYSFNTAEKLNTLLLRMIRRMRLIKVGSHVDLDFDHQFVPAHKFDAKYSYKQDFGYFPGWAPIGGIIVGGENRDGNTNVRRHAPSHYGPCNLRTWCGNKAFPCRLRVVFKGNYPNCRAALQHVLYTCCQLRHPM